MTAVTGHTQPFKGLAVAHKVPLGRHTSFRVGGPAEYLATPESIDALTGLLRAAKAAKIPVTILGGGTNVLVSDDGIPGLVIRLSALKGADIREMPDEVLLRAGTGQTLSSLCRMAAEKGLTGLEWAAGIPGTLGGAVMMNAGSFGSDMAAIIQKIDILDLGSLRVKTLVKKDLAFSYRSLDLENAVVIGADLGLTAADPEAVRITHAANLKVKTTTQPVSQASAGCFFKNPAQEKPAGWLIEQAGLKGHTYKGARVSNTHANFIVNHDHATCRDILDLAKTVTARVAEEFKITLEKEVKIIGS